MLPKRFNLLLMALLAVLASAVGTRTSSAIIGGKIAQNNAYPFAVSLSQTGHGFVCTASLIDPQWVLTAAHCVENDDGTSVKAADVFAHVGSTKAEGGDRIEVRSIHIHPGWNRATKVSDLALLRLARPPRSHVSFATIDLERTVNYYGKPPKHTRQVGGAFNKDTEWRKVSVIGWGRTSPEPKSPASPDLKELTLSIVNPYYCSDRWAAIRIVDISLALQSMSVSPNAIETLEAYVRGHARGTPPNTLCAAENIGHRGLPGVDAIKSKYDPGAAALRRIYRPNEGPERDEFANPHKFAYEHYLRFLDTLKDLAPSIRQVFGVDERDAENTVCSGDSGGPLFRQDGDRFVQVGVTSFVSYHEIIECGFLLATSVFMEVGVHYPWIKSVMDDGSR